MVLACSELREALLKVSSSTKTAFFKRSLLTESRLMAISDRLAIAALHLSSLPFPFSCCSILLLNLLHHFYISNNLHHSEADIYIGRCPPASDFLSIRTQRSSYLIKIRIVYSGIRKGIMGKSIFSNYKFDHSMGII